MFCFNLNTEPFPSLSSVYFGQLSNETCFFHFKEKTNKKNQTLDGFLKGPPFFLKRVLNYRKNWLQRRRTKHPRSALPTFPTLPDWTSRGDTHLRHVSLLRLKPATTVNLIRPESCKPFCFATFFFLTMPRFCRLHFSKPFRSL